ncbi:hypothetical protein PAXRUDRAFT_828768 [Paxillus rubicundulus Ve08.2h10]|uniref:Uncharacterized protein n=1 Tax=Paxillus rubicundulus Ve08.2h10 TaxID=930991 RepID=A0A0D0E0W6_9AGAM|nr:hypothetical protein PAXRUDRAFT_828768 [Paxillus rubicundulus Ve08.2h10]
MMPPIGVYTNAPSRDGGCSRSSDWPSSSVGTISEVLIENCKTSNRNRVCVVRKSQAWRKDLRSRAPWRSLVGPIEHNLTRHVMTSLEATKRALPLIALRIHATGILAHEKLKLGGTLEILLWSLPNTYRAPHKRFLHTRRISAGGNKRLEKRLVPVDARTTAHLIVGSFPDLPPSALTGPWASFLCQLADICQVTSGSHALRIT